MDLGDGTRNCGRMTVTGASQSYKLMVAMIIPYWSFGGRFKCIAKSVKDRCQCGQRNTGKIVNGNETLINEFPMMAGLVDVENKALICGATISKITLYSLLQYKSHFYQFPGIL